MICFEILVNGNRICLAGVDSGVLGAHVTAFQAPIDEGDTTERESRLNLFVSASSNKQNFRWPVPNETPLALGDEVTFRIVEADTPDEGVRHYRQENGKYSTTPQPEDA